MKDRFKKTVATILMVSIIAGNFVYPTPAYARISFNRFTRSLGRIARHVGRGTRFVVNLPDKATRWMGPVVGPIVSTILTKNIAKNARWGKVFKQAGRASRAYDSIEEKEKYLAELRKAYHGQAGDLRTQANEIRNSRTQLQNKLTSGEITYADYRDHVLSLENIAQIYETAADKFDRSADRMRIEDIVRIFTRDTIKQVFGQVKNAAIFETTREINKVIDPQIVLDIIGGKSVNFDTFIDGLTSYQIKKHIDGEDRDFDVDELKDRVRDRIKDILEENKDEFKHNRREKVDEIIKNMIKEIEDEKKNLPEVEKENKNEDSEDDLDKYLDVPSESSDDKCKNGYEWNIKLGKCIQSNCYPEQIPNAHHSYTLDCVCGSSGSINENSEDPNQECRYPGDHKSCPNCVYACVGIKDECPAISDN